MGLGSSKLEKDEALRLCKQRKRFLSQAIDSRYDFAAAHVAYIQSLRNIGVALRRYAEAEILACPPSAAEAGKTTPSHSSYHPSPSPSRNLAVELLEGSGRVDLGARAGAATVSCMRSGGGVAVTMRFTPAASGFVVDEEQMGFSPPPPPPPPPGGSWDYFDTSADAQSSTIAWMPSKNGDTENEAEHFIKLDSLDSEPTSGAIEQNAAVRTVAELEAVVAEHSANKNGGTERCDKVEDLPGEREDPSEFITHRAKDFLSSIKDIEFRFSRASEAGRDVSRLLEANKIRVGFTNTKGSPTSVFRAAIGVVCCKRNSLVSNEPAQAKVVTWNRSTSSRSSSSKNPLTTGSKDENDDSGSEFGEEFCMFAGSHSSTLERLYAWERKLHDEVKASEIIMKEYDRKCRQLTRQFAKDVSSRVIDKTRAAVKDLHSRIRVALHACDSISKRIEKIRDDELLPQLFELVQGLTRMWKAMLECHHAQYITISLAYHKKSATTGTPDSNARREILARLRDEVECFGLSFADWINSHTSYVQSLNGYLQNCITLPQERSRSRRVFSPRRVLAPPIFVICRDWSAGVQSLPCAELAAAVKIFLTDIDRVIEQQESENTRQSSTQENGQNQSHNLRASSLNSIQSGLTKVLDKLTKFSESSVKMCEDVRQKSEAARVAYSNCRQARF
uniref:BZIP transcription factor n=1 Tax=Kalanchoe fedtschenkoi TaxID=63787 RepID=A0A7N0T8M3_KALFE